MPYYVYSQIIQQVVKPEVEVMLHRSSYHGGKYRNTQSCSAHSCTKLGSDSEYLINDKATKKNLTNWCSEDDTLKKRKRQHVARRLFRADE